MGFPLLLSKTRIPKPQKGLIPRPMLSGRLGEALSHPLVLISAPAGFGKTSLAAQYIAGLGPGTGILPAWISLDAEDDDPIRFWSVTATAFDRALQAQGDPCTPSPSTPSPFTSISDAAHSHQPPGDLELASAIIDGVLSTGKKFIF